MPQTRNTPPIASTSSVRPANKPKKRSRPSSHASKEPPPQPSGPEFALPDPSAPPPPNFLRNQENLLGRAGLVAGVKPSQIAHVRGSTPSYPILVDEEDAPILGRRSRSQEPYIDPALLTAPTNQEIVSVLIGQKNIFPILEGVLKLVVGSVATTSTPQASKSRRIAAPQHLQADQAVPVPTLKRRKLNRVPAGAADWDVPYPFQEGEGPDAYQKTWERERGKQLISQLIKQIKIAARKAATKKYLQARQEAEEKERRRSNRTAGSNSPKRTDYYRPSTATYAAQEENKVYDVLQDASNASWIPSSSDPGQSRSSQPSAGSPPTTTVQPENMPEMQPFTTPTFEQLLDSYASSLQGQDAGSLNSFSEMPPNLAFPNTSDNQQGSSSSSLLDQSVFDSWMTSFLESFPPSSFDGQSTDFSSAPTSHCSTPTPGLDNFAFTNMVESAAAAQLDVLTASPEEVANMLASVFNQQGTTTNSGLPSSLGDHMIDPTLLSISAPSTNNLPSIDSSSNPSMTQAPSPMASTSSLSGNDPATPASAGWDASMPDVYMGGSGDAGGQGWDAGNGGGIPMFVDDSMQNFGLLPEPMVTQKEFGQSGTATAVRVDKGKGKAVDQISTPANTSSMPLPASASEAVFRALIGALTPTSAPTPPVAVPPQAAAAASSRAARKARKDDIIKRAKEKRQKLQEELDSVKMQLWGTTVEQAGLVHLARRLEELESSGLGSTPTPALEGEVS